MFEQNFDSYVSDLDTITTKIDGFTAIARIHRDDWEKPDERDEGFWPSLDPEESLTEGGYLGMCGFYLYSHVHKNKVYVGAAVDPRVVLSHLTKAE